MRQTAPGPGLGEIASRQEGGSVRAESSTRCPIVKANDDDDDDSSLTDSGDGSSRVKETAAGDADV